VTGAGQEAEQPSEPEDLVARFRASRGGATARFAATQAAILRSLVGQVAELLGADPDEPSGADAPAAPERPDDDMDLQAQLGLTENASRPDDPVLARLLPDAYADDADSAAEFRRYTESGLRAGKVDAARTVLSTLPASGGKVRLNQEQSQDWLRALNDVRLALGVRLGVTEDFDELVTQLSADDPRAAYVWVYQWLAYLQESLVEALS
jgi:hypothetical protein